MQVVVKLIDGSTVANIDDAFAHFSDNTDAGPFDLIISKAATRGKLKTGHVTITIAPNGNDTWRSRISSLTCSSKMEPTF